MKAVTAAPALLLVIWGCGPAKLAGAWQNRAFADNGFIEDWTGALTTVADDRLTVGALNDEERLYLYLCPEDFRSGMSLYRRGFTIWLGEGKERRGIRFPIEGLAGPPEVEERRGRGRRSEQEGETAEGMRMPPPRLKYVDLLGPDEAPIRSGKLGEVAGVAIVTSSAGRLPAVQIAIALHASSPEEAGVHANPGDKVRIGLTSPKFDFEGMRGRYRGGDGDEGGPLGGDGGHPGGGGPFPGGGGRMGGAPGGRRFAPPEPFDLSAKLELATPPDPARRE